MREPHVGCPPRRAPRAVRDVAMWTQRARTATPRTSRRSPTHEGAVGLVEAAAEPELRADGAPRDGLRARLGAAPVPRAARRAGKDDDEARLALEAAVELAARPRRSEDVEDADELREGCEKLGALARDATRDARSAHRGASARSG